MFSSNQKRILLLASLSIFFTASAYGTNHTVAMKSISYDPKVIDVKIGDSIEWKNEALTEHSATSYENERPSAKFDTGLIEPHKQSKKIEFQEVGKFQYHCKVHGKTMTATVNVSK